MHWSFFFGGGGGGGRGGGTHTHTFIFVGYARGQLERYLSGFPPFQNACNSREMLGSEKEGFNNISWSRENE